MIDRYFERFPGIRDYIHDDAERGARDRLHHHPVRPQDPLPRHPQQGAARTPGGGARRRQRADQGTSADIIKRAMVRMCPALEREGLGGVRMLMQVHDELVFEVPEADVEQASAVIRRVMERAAEPAVSLSVPLGVEIGTGANWGAAH
jgi:DNA polymerase-1